MQRREFITLLGGAAVAWPHAALGQQRKLPVIGYLYSGSLAPTTHLVAAFLKGLGETGYVDGQNVVIEYYWANNDRKRLSELAADVVQRRVDVIVTPASAEASVAAKSATNTIPIVFGLGVDPVRAGLVASINRPGGNATGLSSMNVELAAKRLGLLDELLPRGQRVAVLINPNIPLSPSVITELQEAASTAKREFQLVTATTERDFDSVFASLIENQTRGLIVSPDPLFVNRRVRLAELALSHKIPTIFGFREDAQAGGLISYGASIVELVHQIGIYAGRILKGEKPAEMPVLRPTKFDMVINLKTARAIGLTMPDSFLLRADEVIE